MNAVKVSLKTRINGLILSVLCITAILLTGLSTWFSMRIADNIISYTFQMKLSGDIQAMKEYVAGHYGKITLINGQLCDFEGISLAENYDVVDKISEDLGVAATIFAREADDFVRISTSIRKADGQRAVGTKLGSSSAAYTPVMNKKTVCWKSCNTRKIIPHGV